MIKREVLQRTRLRSNVKYEPLPVSRHSSTAFALAGSLADEFSTALLAQLGQVTATPSESSSSPTNTSETTGAKAQLYAVQLHRYRMRVRFDVFLDHCTPEFRSQIDETVARPIHAITKLGHKDGDGYQVDRNPLLDIKVAREIEWVQGRDEGPRPYFTDNMTRMFYDDGIRVEDNLEELYPFFLPSKLRSRHERDS
ncbi:hypothetical protein C8A00DRAFT_15735 [Chaetomidium leptoderma]|uniref:Uncharacterized protein n=1 Tax=Chaetomidium leptoderma TaxID=669021 RepID=A0AAN6ZWS9_9PEZI|nr:hypothetical protein C8A00DRAFT_15735 [Chaetomidium leptoderma]